MNIADNPWSFQAQGETTLDEYPNLPVFIKRLHIYGGSATGNLMILDHEGHTLREGGGRHVAETVNLRDPQIVHNSSITNDSFTVMEINQYVNGLFVDDIPPGARVDVFHGAP